MFISRDRGLRCYAVYFWYEQEQKRWYSQYPSQLWQSLPMPATASCLHSSAQQATTTYKNLLQHKEHCSVHELTCSAAAILPVRHLHPPCSCVRTPLTRGSLFMRRHIAAANRRRSRPPRLQLTVFSVTLSSVGGGGCRHAEPWCHQHYCEPAWDCRNRRHTEALILEMNELYANFLLSLFELCLTIYLI
jgi:hypothetical protein